MTLQEFIIKNKEKYQDRKDPYSDAATDFITYKIKVLKDKLEKGKDE